MPIWDRSRRGDRKSRRRAGGPLAAWLAATGLFLASLLVGLYLSQPTDSLRQRLRYEIENRAPVTVELTEVRLRPLLSLKGGRTALVFDEPAGYRLTIDSFTFDPWWSSLLSGDPGLEGEFTTMGGRLDVRMRRSGRTTVTAKGADIFLPLATQPPLQLAGAQLEARLETVIPLDRTSESLLSLAAEQVRVAGLEMLTGDDRAIPLGTVRVEATGRGRSFILQRFEATGGVFEARGEGTLLLGSDPSSSRVKLDLSLKPGPQATSNMTSLLELTGPKQADGSYRLRLAGTLAEPVIE